MRMQNEINSTTSGAHIYEVGEWPFIPRNRKIEHFFCSKISIGIPVGKKTKMTHFLIFKPTIEKRFMPIKPILCAKFSSFGNVLFSP